MGLYRFLTDLTAPGISLYLRLRRARGKEDSVRFPERLGRPSLSRPEGPLVWCHAASVGESLSVLCLLETIRKTYPAWSVLITTGTVTSARLLAGRLPRGAFHQYLPVDRWPYVMRFLDHWRPDLALWVESELWPNTLAALHERCIPAVLLNGRISEKSLRRWRLMEGWAKNILRSFTLVLAQSEAERDRFRTLGATDVRYLGNLKFAATPLPCDELELDRLRTQTGTRPVWMMASTHPGEEEIAMAIHAHLRGKWPDLLTIVVPRHAVRGNAIMKQISRVGLRGAQRSRQKNIQPAAEIYLADTMGELGLFYRLAPVICIGGTFTWGGHNPIEPAQLGCAVLFGPNMTNFAAIAEDMLAHRAAFQVHSPNELAVRLEQLLAAPDEMFAMANAGRVFVDQRSGVLHDTLQLLTPWLEGPTVGKHEGP